VDGIAFFLRNYTELSPSGPSFRRVARERDGGWDIHFRTRYDKPRFGDFNSRHSCYCRSHKNGWSGCVLTYETEQGHEVCMVTSATVYCFLENSAPTSTERSIRLHLRFTFLQYPVRIHSLERMSLCFRVSPQSSQESAVTGSLHWARLLKPFKDEW
jgi:hypothetical protein